MGIFDFWIKKEPAKEEAKVSIPTKEAKSLSIINVDDKSEIVLKFLEKNYRKVCIYPEINLIKEEDQLEILKDAWNNWNKRKPDIKGKYDENVLKIIYAMEDSRLTNYYKFFNHMLEKKCGLCDFLEFYTPEECNSFVKCINGKYKTAKEWIRVCHVEDMLKTTDILRRSNGKYYVYNYTMAKGDKETKYVLLFKNFDFIKMSSEEFKTYCENNNCINPLWFSSKDKEESAKRWELRKQKMSASSKTNEDLKIKDLTEYFI